MKGEKREDIQFDEIEHELGKIYEIKHRGPGIRIDMGSTHLNIRKDSIDVGLTVRRPGHDHGDTAWIKLVGLDFVCPEDGSEYKTPVISFSPSYVPTFKNAKRLRHWFLNDLEDEIGKEFGYAKEKLVIHAHEVDDINKDCLVIIASRGALDRLYKLIQFKEKK